MPVSGALRSCRGLVGPGDASRPTISSYRRSGRKPAIRSFDAIIAATAIANGLPLDTANPSDFEGIEGLEVRAVPPPGHER